MAVLLAIWAAAACAVDGNAAPTARPSPSPSEVAAPSPSPTPTPSPTPSPIATRIAWPPMPDANQYAWVSMLAGTAGKVAMPAAVPATKDLGELKAEFESQFLAPGYVFVGLQNLRDGRFHGSEPYIFANTFAPSAFADRVREMLQTPHPDETRQFVPKSATLDRGWRGLNGVMLVEATVVFDDEVGTTAGVTHEGHSWAIRALRLGSQYYILDGAEGGGLGATAPFDPAALDREIVEQVAQHLSQEQATPGGGRPTAMYKGTAYWNVRKGALDWLATLAEQGVLTDRHFEAVTAQVTEFMPTSSLGDGIVTVKLKGTLVEVMRGVRHTYPVNELVRFQRTAAAHAMWLAVDGLDDNGAWLMHGSYTAVPEPIFHG